MVRLQLLNRDGSRETFILVDQLQEVIEHEGVRYRNISGPALEVTTYVEVVD